MQEFDITVTLPDETVREFHFTKKVHVSEIASQVQDAYDAPLILAVFNGKLRELSRHVKSSGKMTFLTVSDKDGMRAYRRSVVLLMEAAVRHLYGEDAQVRVLHSLGEGIYCEIWYADEEARRKAAEEGKQVRRTRLEIEEGQLDTIKRHMQQLRSQDLPIIKHNERTDMVVDLFDRMGLPDKKRLFIYRRSSRTNLYELDGLKDYYYGYMAPSTGILRYFDLVPYQDSFVLLFPGKDYQIPQELSTSEKLFHTLQSTRAWSRSLGVGSIGMLNDMISSGKGQEIILLQEAHMEDQIGDLALKIAQDHDKKFVMIAGPSSSGKTSFANRLSIQLTAKGKIPHLISLDNYYLDRDKCPKDENGDPDLECLEALDVELFNQNMNDLLHGKEVGMPTFNFKTGKREYRGDALCLQKDDVLVIEGIHGLNPRMSYALPAESKFRIYLSALTMICIDEHNPLSTTDVRLLRRIVRDARTRNTTARETIAMWHSVHAGEEKYIFPFQQEADVMFNSALMYELAVLKVYAEPLLFQISVGEPEYSEAKRLLKLLDYLLPLPAEGINRNSLIREFVGGSCFNV